MSFEKVSIAVVGGGGLIGVRHTQHVVDEDASTLAAIVDPTPAGVALAASLHVPSYSSLDELVSDRAAGKIDVDGVILATPNATHVPLSVQALQAGMNVLLEKPMSTDVPSGKVLVNAAKASEGQLEVLVGHHRRFNPYIVKLKKMLDEDLLGRILAISGMWTALKPPAYFEEPTAWRKQGQTGGVILINLVHDIDLMRYLFGDITRVYAEEGARTRGHAVEETGALTVRFASGAVGTFVFSDATASPYSMESATGENPIFPQKSQNTYTILGTRGSTAFPELKRWHYTKPDGSWTDHLSLDDAETVDDIAPFTNQLRHFINVIRKTEPSKCTAAEALKTIITIEAIRESISTGKPVEITHS